VAREGKLLQPGSVHVAPDDFHLGVSAARRTIAIRTEPVNGFRPSSSMLFESAANAYAARLACVILTGMGNDGASGLRRVKDRDGYVIAPDEASSLIYGTLREAINAGLVDVSLPLDLIAEYMNVLANK
jgi:two-component system chemotaxis response regulator CheB